MYERPDAAAHADHDGIDRGRLCHGARIRQRLRQRRPEQGVEWAASGRAALAGRCNGCDDSIMFRSAGILGVLVLGALASGCAEGDGSAPLPRIGDTPTTEGTAAPTATAPVARDLAALTLELRRIVEATARKDVDALAAMIAPRQAGCVDVQQVGTPPQCEAGEAPGTPLDVLLVVACDGGDVRLPDALQTIRRALERPFELYTVFASVRSVANRDHRVVFAYNDAESRDGFIFDVTDGKITSLRFTCLTVVDQTRTVAEFLVPPPYGPHAQAPRHLKEASVASFVATPYNTFMVTGAFDHVIDEVGDADPFAWNVSGTLTYDGQDRSWRLYWHSGEVFDCAQSCTDALSAVDARARLAALETGTSVCVVGWTDDVGNAQSELVFLHAPEPCPVPDGFFSRPTVACLRDPRAGGGRTAMIDYPSREVYVTEPGGSRMTVLAPETPGSSYAYTDPTLSPSGKTMVVGANLRQEDGSFRTGLWSFDLGGGEPRLLYPTDDGQTFSVDGPAYSPDGKRLVFTRVAIMWRSDHGHDDRYEIWVMDAEGSNALQVAEGRQASWSDDGAYILYDTQTAPGPALERRVVDAQTFATVTLKIGPC